MFTVHWMKDGKSVHRLAMLAANSADALKVALEETPKIVATIGEQPDAIRVQDQYLNQTMIHTLEGTDASRS